MLRSTLPKALFFYNNKERSRRHTRVNQTRFKSDNSFDSREETADDNDSLNMMPDSTPVHIN